VVEADSINRLELPHHVHHLRLVLQAVNYKRLEENRIGPLNLLPVLFADPDAVLVVQPDQDRLLQPTHGDARDDERHADECHDAGDDRDEVVLQQNFPAEEEGVLFPGLDEV